MLYFTWKFVRTDQKRSACSMSMIAARMQKLKAGNLTGIGNHNQRKGQNHSNQEIDPNRSHLNYELVNRTEHYQKDIQTFIDEKKISTRAVRSDAVLVNEWIITSDRTFFNGLTEQETKEFFEAAKEYFSEKFGEDNIRYATVHVDETTPHMHMGIVPFDSEGKLSAKRVFNRQTLRDIQEELPTYLQEAKFDIERGQKGSERKNLTVPEFKEMKREQKEVQQETEKMREEFRAYVTDRKITVSLDDIKATIEREEIKIPSGEKFLGIDIPKKVERETGNVILSKKDFDKMQDFNTYIKKSESRFLNLLDTDLYQENKALKKEIKVQKSTNHTNIEDYNQLVREYNTLSGENDRLKSRISDLKKEVRIIYNTVKSFLKERTSEIQAFKSMFKALTDDISLSSKDNQLDSQFKKEFDKEHTQKRTRGRSR